MIKKPLYTVLILLVFIAGCKDDRTPEMNGPHMLSVVSGEIFWTMGHEAYPIIEVEDGNGFITTITLDYDPQTAVTDPRGDGSVYSIVEYCGRY